MTLYSVATAGGTVNITPITSLIALNVAAGNIQTLLTGSAGALPGVTAADLNTQNTNVDTLLSPVLTADGVSATYNFSATTFSAGDTGYSKLLNTVSVNLASPAAVVVTNTTVPDISITIDTNHGGPNGSLDVINGPKSLPIGVTVGGTIKGLTGAGLQLQNKGADTLAVAANATSFTFATDVASGGAYAVTVKAQPSGQSCVVSNGAGTAANSNVTNVTVTCTTTPVFTVGGTISGLTGTGLVIEDNGTDDLALAAGATTFSFATRLVSMSTYQVTVKAPPAGETCSVSNGSGTIASGNIVNIAVTCTPYYTVGGTVSNLKGVTLSLILQNNGGYSANAISLLPGQSSFSFGIGLPNGTGYTATVQQQPAGQMCTVTNGSGTLSGSNVSSINVSCATVPQWAWIRGDDTSLGAVYGAQGQAAAGNSPGGRSQAATSVDTAGNLWLFGGAYANSSLANDLWEYSPGTGQWRWVGGSSSQNSAGVYGTQGVAASANVPGARYGAVSWTDSAGNFWLFGGQGYDSTGTQSWLNDLWEFNVATGQWLWVSGSSLGNASGVYGTAEVASATNQPGARLSAFGWIDSANNLWLEGGTAFDGNGVQTTLNDLWKFDAGSAQWTWVNGSQSIVPGVYGTQGVPDPANTPGSRQAAATWIDSAGQMWLFGGYGQDSAGTYDALNDLWRYSPASNQWTWMGGSTIVDARGVYGVQGVEAATNSPGARYGATSWTDLGGALWLVGGEGYDSTSNAANIQNDIWKYDSTSGQWAWISGGSSDGGGDPGVYQVQGLPGAGNSPGARTTAMSWTDASGSWLYGGDAASPQLPGASSYTISQGANDLWHFGPAVFYNGTGSMTGTFTDQNGCKYTANAVISNANVTLSTENAGAVTVTFSVPTFTAQSSNAATCGGYQAYTSSFAIPININGSTVLNLAGSTGSVSGSFIGGAFSATVSYTITGPQGSGTFSLTESGSFSTTATTVTVPNLVGLTEGAASSAITNAGLWIATVTRQNSNTVAAGDVISQTPAANSMVATGSSVSFAISTGPASETVPNVVGLSQAAADSAIIGGGLAIGSVTQQNNATVPSGSVVSETPAADATVPTGSAVNLVVSLGPLLVAVPDVTGLSQTAATTAITGAGLTVGSVSVQASTIVPSGYIVSETPAVVTSHDN